MIVQLSFLLLFCYNIIILGYLHDVQFNWNVLIHQFIPSLIGFIEKIINMQAIVHFLN